MLNIMSPNMENNVGRSFDEVLNDILQNLEEI